WTHRTWNGPSATCATSSAITRSASPEMDMAAHAVITSRVNRVAAGTASSPGGKDAARTAWVVTVTDSCLPHFVVVRCQPTGDRTALIVTDWQLASSAARMGTVRVKGGPR